MNTSATADEVGADGNFLATTANASYSGSGASPGVYIGGTEISGQTDNAGTSLFFGVVNLYLVINYSIALEGIFPSRN